jgi:hypothetical protein
MKHRSKGRRKAPISRPSGGPVFVSPEDQKRMSLDTVMLQQVQAIRSPNFKDSISDRAYHDAALAAWSAMHRYQQEQLPALPVD